MDREKERTEMKEIWKGEYQEQIWRERRTKVKSTIVCSFSYFAGHRRCRREVEKKSANPPPKEGKNNKPKKKKKQENRSEGRRKNQKLCLCLSPFAGNGGRHNRQEREEKKKAGQIHLFLSIACGGTWTHALPVAAASGANTSPLFRRPKGFTTLFLWLGVSSTFHDFSSALFCKFKLFNVLFVLFWTLIFFVIFSHGCVWVYYMKKKWCVRPKVIFFFYQCYWIIKSKRQKKNLMFKFVYGQVS